MNDYSNENHLNELKFGLDVEFSEKIEELFAKRTVDYERDEFLIFDGCHRNL